MTAGKGSVGRPSLGCGSRTSGVRRLAISAPPEMPSLQLPSKKTGLWRRVSWNLLKSFELLEAQRWASGGVLGLAEGYIMPKLERSQWYDLCRDMNWQFKYVTDAEVFPEALSQSHGVSPAAWWNWDEPYKICFREYVRNQAEKEAGVYSVRSAIARSRLFENLDPGWKAAIIAHYGAIAMPEYLASIGEARMGRFGRAAAWRN